MFLAKISYDSHVADVQWECDDLQELRDYSPYFSQNLEVNL